MAKVEGEGPNSEELKRHADEPAPADLAAEPLPEPMAGPPAPEDESAAATDLPEELAATEEAFAAPPGEPTEAEGVQAETEEAAEGEEEEAEEEEGEEEEKEPSKLPLYLEWAGVIGIPLIILGLALLYTVCFSQAFNAFSTAIYLIALGFIPYGIWKGRETPDVFTLFLACALAAVLTAAYCMWLEMGRYDLDIRARGAKQRVGMSQPFSSGPANATAAAWPRQFG